MLFEQCQCIHVTYYQLFSRKAVSTKDRTIYLDAQLVWRNYESLLHVLFTQQQR